MIYVLIFIAQLTTGATSTSVEFNSKNGCVAAANELQAQSKEKFGPNASWIVSCVPKGVW